MYLKSFRCILRTPHFYAFTCKRCMFSSRLAALKSRNLFSQQLPDPLTPDLVSDLDSSQNWSIYCGIDPTGPSLHLGHLFPLMALFHLRRLGYPVIVLIGGATAKIGDPSDKKDEREKLSVDYLTANAEKLERQIVHLDERFKSQMQMESYGELRIVNNLEWYDNENLVPFLSQHARFMSVSHMLSLSFVKDRLNSGARLNLAEFFYQFLQAFDFQQLYERYNCRAQVGGSDQWGNMLGGYEFLKSSKGIRTLSLTTPLLLSGASKMGKTSSSVSSKIWLDKNLTSPYALYQYFLQRSDSESPQMANSLTFLDDKELQDILNSTDVRSVQKCLAKKVVQFVHGEKDLRDAESVTSLLHSKKPSLDDVDEKCLKDVLKNAEIVSVSRDLSIVECLSRTSFFTAIETAEDFSKKGGTVKINGAKISSLEARIEDVSSSDYAVLALGKHYRAVLQIKPA